MRLHGRVEEDPLVALALHQGAAVYLLAVDSSQRTAISLFCRIQRGRCLNRLQVLVRHSLDVKSDLKRGHGGVLLELKSRCF
jgi:hypothetical protein